MVEYGTPWYGSMRLGELNRTIQGRPGFDNFEQSYSSAVRWARGTLACSPGIGVFELFTSPHIFL